MRIITKQKDVTMRRFGYWSGTLPKLEKKVVTTYEYCWAVVWAILLLFFYLKERWFSVRKDCEPPEVYSHWKGTAKLSRCQLRPLELDCDILHRAGVKNQAANALSRLKTERGVRRTLEDETPVINIVGQRQTHNGNSEDDSDEDGSDNH